MSNFSHKDQNPWAQYIKQRRVEEFFVFLSSIIGGKFANKKGHVKGEMYCTTFLLRAAILVLGRLL